MNIEFTFYWFPAFVFFTLKDSQIVKSQESKTKEEWSYSDDKWFTSTFWNEVYVGRRLRAEPKTFTSEGRLYHVVISRSFAWIPQHLAFRTVTEKLLIAWNLWPPRIYIWNRGLRFWRLYLSASLALYSPAVSTVYTMKSAEKVLNHFVNTKNLFLV